MVILKQDGLEREVAGISPPTNDDVIALLSARHSLFSLINEKTPHQQFRDADMIHGFEKDFGKDKLLSFNKIHKTMFTVTHSQCQVTYDITGFKLKNMDRVSPEISEVYLHLFENKNKAQEGKTLLAKFSKEIEDLVNELSTATNHFVRCIKPNEEKLAKKVDEGYMLTQVRYLGVFETVQIRQKVFPSRKTYHDFVDTFQAVFEAAKGKEEREAVGAILEAVKAEKKDYLMGKARIYMSKTIEDRLNKELYLFFKVKHEKAAVIQRTYRRYKFRTTILAHLKVLVRRKKIWKMFELRERLKMYKHSLGLIRAAA